MYNHDDVLLYVNYNDNTSYYRSRLITSDSYADKDI